MKQKTLSALALHLFIHLFGLIIYSSWAGVVVACLKFCFPQGDVGAPGSKGEPGAKGEAVSQNSHKS